MNKSESKYFHTAELMDKALLILIEKKDFEYITVKEICEKAGVNRSTFYLHYESTCDLLEETLEYVNRRFVASFGEKTVKKFRSAIRENFVNGGEQLICPEYLIPYLEFIKENKRLFASIHDKPQLFRAEEAFSAMYKDIFNPVMDKFGVSEEEKPYVFWYYAKGTLAIVMEWVKRGCVLSVGKITDIIMKCIPQYKK